MTMKDLKLTLFNIGTVVYTINRLDRNSLKKEIIILILISWSENVSGKMKGIFIFQHTVNIKVTKRH